MTTTRYDAVVVGGGHNGLTAAAVLARAGRQVALVERRDRLGGLAAGEEFWPGYRGVGLLHDAAAIRDWIIDDLQLEKHGLERRSTEAPVFIPDRSGEGEGLLLHRRAADAAEEIGQRSGSDAAGYRAYRDFIDTIRPWLRSLVDRRPPRLLKPAHRDLMAFGRAALGLRRLGRHTMSELLRIAPMCAADWLGERFESELLRAALAAPALYDSGLGPRAPGTNTNLLLDECLNGPAIVGGPAALVASLESCARQQGVEMLTATSVERIELSSGAVVGVLLDNGERLATSAVAASCDPKRLFFELLEPHHLPLRLLRHLRGFRSRAASAKMLLALSALPKLACRAGFESSRLRIGGRIDDLERAADALKYRRFSAAPVLDVRIPTLECAELAPAGHHVLSVLIHCVPYELEGGWNAERSAQLSDTVIERLEEYMPQLRETIVGHELLTPVDIEKRYATTGGHLFHGDKALDQLLIRPIPECSRYTTPFEGLFLCGSGSHGGGGINALPGALAARTMLGRQ